MKFGPIPPKKLPEQDTEKVLLLAERWQRASYSHEKWATPAKVHYDFFENRQYTEEQIAAAGKSKPLLKFNMIAPIVRLVIGYHGQNRSDIQFSPAHDPLATDDVATALSGLEKAIVTDNLLEFIDPDVFMDGLVCGRGWFDTQLDWERNDLGEVRTVSLDPFSVKVDPDANTYDINESASYMMTDKMVSVDEIEGNFGKQVADLVRPWTRGQTPLAPLSSVIFNDEITPIRSFGLREDADRDYWDNLYSLMGDFVDVHRKTIRLIETQYKLRELRNVMIDLETGDKKVLPDDWGRDKIDKALLYAEMVGNPCIVQQRMVERFHWTTMCGDMILYDAPSFYDAFTMTGYFPYFRRGVTRGMVEDLVDAQKEKNKSHNNRVEIESKTANGGWLYGDDAFDAVQEANLKKFGSQPGVNIKYKANAKNKPERIDASPPATAYERLERSSDEDMHRISGINETALGQESNKAQSGRAYEALQRQAVVSVQMYMDHFRRTKHLLGQRHLHIIQNYYTEQRIYRVTGEDGKKAPIVINQMMMDPVSNGKRIINDVTLGKYSVVVDDAPLSPSFAAAQYDEMMALVEKLAAGGMSITPFLDLIIGMSSMPRKNEWIDRITTLLGAQQAPVPGGAPPAPGGAPPPGPGGNVIPMPARA